MIEDAYEGYYTHYVDEDGKSLAYNCNSCGYMYRTGVLGLETPEGEIVCEPDKYECPQCSCKLYMPLLWRSKKEAEMYFESFPDDVERIEFIIVEKDAFEVTYVDVRAMQKHLH